MLESHVAPKNTAIEWEVCIGAKVELEDGAKDGGLQGVG